MTLPVECSRHAAAHGNHLRVRELIEDKGVGVDARDRDGGRTCLHWACKNADVKLIKYLPDLPGKSET